MQGLIPAAWRVGASLSAPALRQMLRRRATRGKEAASRLREREGYETAARPGGKLLWLHAASVGETISVLPVLSSLAAAAPELQILFTTGTVTSARLLEQRLPELGLHRVMHRFVPLDVPAWAARFLDHWQPDAAAFIESELWPNLLAACQARRIPLVLLNARMSARSFRAWQRAPGFARQVIGAFDLVHPQSPDYGARLAALGAKGLTAPGNLKFAAAPLPVNPAELDRLRSLIGTRKVWLAASTHPGEEELAAQLHHKLAAAHPGLLTIIAPRHPARGAEIAAALGGVPRRGCGGGPEAGIWIVDTMGELGLLYRLSPLVFMGRSMIGKGGQNPLEAARLGCAIAVGPHTGNFADVVARLQRAGGLTVVQDAAALEAWVGVMLCDPAGCATAGQAAQAVANGEGDLPGRIAADLLGVLAR